MQSIQGSHVCYHSLSHPLLQFELEAVNGERVSITVKDPMMEQDLGVQFA